MRCDATNELHDRHWCVPGLTGVWWLHFSVQFSGLVHSARTVEWCQDPERIHIQALPIAQESHTHVNQ
eukprot:m.174657 g.174657  ORF g.174657 m.174657 type:complete len:68 (+) comp18330_c0_seq1:935-1138(+)